MKSAKIDAAPAFFRGRLSSTGLVVADGQAPQPVLGFIDAVLRGIGQVMLQNNSFTGLIFLAGIFCNSLLFGGAVLLGTAASTATAMLLGVDRVRIREG